MIGRSKDSAPTPEVEQPAVGKGRPTPKRKVAEAAHHRPLVVDDRRQATKNARAKQRAQRDLEYQAMLSGDERHMPARDAGPVKHFVRDYVDSRFNTGQYFLPIAVAFLLVSLITTRYPVAFFVLTGVLYLYVLVVLVDAIVLWFQLKKALVAEFGPGAERGNLMYGVLRSTQLPRTRLPRPQVKRGGKPVTPKAPKA